MSGRFIKCLLSVKITMSNFISFAPFRYNHSHIQIEQNPDISNLILSLGYSIIHMLRVLEFKQDLLVLPCTL